MSIKNNVLVFILLWLLYPFTALAEVCDVDGDADIDRNDINLILAARGQTASGPDDPRDATGDGIISVNDVRACSLQCTLPRCAIIDPPIEVPTIDIAPDPLDFGDVFVGSSVNQSLVVNNTGTATLSVSNIESSGAPFNVFPPLSFDIAESGLPRNVEIGFSPTVAGDFNGTITFHSNADNEDPVVIAVTGRGVEPTPDLEADIDVRDAMDFGAVIEGNSVEQLLTIQNLGDAPLTVTALSTDEPAFVASALAGDSFPFTLGPGVSQNVSVVFTAPAGSAGSSVTGTLSIESNDPDESPKAVSLRADVIQVFAQLINNPILGASVDAIIDNSNCSDVTGGVKFGDTANGADAFLVRLTDQSDASVSSGFFSSSNGAGIVAFSGIDACGLDDGILKLSVELASLDPFIGDPAIKHTTTFPAPVLDAVAPVSVLSTIEVCGTSRESTTVKIEGGASIVSETLDAATTNFCLNVPLRANTENTLIATAIDDIAAAPKPSASAAPVQVTHVDPSSIIIAEASSRPLTIEETELLVQNGVINLDDPSNFNVSMFTIVLTIGSFPVTVTQPVPVPSSPGVGFGGGGPGGGWSSVGTGGGGSPSASGGCVVGCSGVVIINTPTGQTIPGVIIIDGRIKTLKEFFQVTIAIQNTSADLFLTDMVANIVLPSGLSPVRAGPGTDVADVNTSGEIDSVEIGEIPPMNTGTGQFIIRGDGIGTHNVDVDFNGFISGGGLTQPFPVNGSAGTSVQVFGPPTLDVVVRHPSHVGAPDVTFGEIYDLVVEITNTSPRPALYTSLELFVGGDAELVDALGVTIPGSNEIRSFGHIPAGRSVAAAFRVRSLVEGEIIACQAIAAENISLTVDTGPDGTACNIANTYPANFVPLPADLPPTVIGINPLNGQPNIPVTTSVIATFTPESDCIVGDTFTNVSYELIDPSDPGKGWKVVNYDLLQPGTFYLEELDDFGNPVKHIPTDLSVETPPAGGTTIAVLRLGLDTPHLNSQYFLKDDPATKYRATLVGGVGGVCSASSGAEMQDNFTWTFSTEQTCGGISAPIASLGSPPDGSIDRPLNQAIVLNFSQGMNPASFAFVPFDLANSSFSVYADAMEAAGEISVGGATPIAGNGVFSNLNKTLTYTPLANFAEDVPVHIRLTDGLRDVCGNPLQTPPSGVQLLSFQTIPPDTLAPPTPSVNPLPVITNSSSVQVSGEAEAGSDVEVSGGSALRNTTASAAGLFSVSVPLNLNAVNDFSVQATDASGNASAPATTDTVGDPLRVAHDNIRPLITLVSPLNGATAVARDAVIQVDFDEQIKPETVNDLNFALEGSVIPGAFAMVGDSAFSFTPDSLLDYNKTYTMRIRANGVRDLAGNGLVSDMFASFTTEDFPLPVLDSVVPDAGVQGTSFSVIFTGSNLATASAVISDNPGVTGTVVSATDISVTADINVDALAATGLTTLGLTTLGGSTSLSFNVTHKAPLISSISPNNGDQGATVNAQINGSGLTDISSITIDGTGVVVNDLGTGNDSVRDVQFIIDASADPTNRTVTVTTPGGSGNGAFKVDAFIPEPDLTSVTPNEGVQGSGLQVTFSGTNLAGANAVISSNPGISGFVVSANDTTVVADILIEPFATVETSQLGVSTPGGSDTVNFTVNAPIVPPIITSIVPDSGVQGTVVTAVINGANFGSLTGLSIDCPEVSITDLGTGTDSRIDVEIGISATAPPGLCVIGVTTLGGFASIDFTVTDAPDTITLTPATGQLLTRGSLSMNVILNAEAPAGGQVINLAASNTLVSLPPTVTVLEGGLSAAFIIESDLDTGLVEISASAAGFTGDSSDVEVVVRGFSLSSPLVGIDRTVTASLSLPQPAPIGGATFDLSVDDPTIVTVSPASITIPQGQSSATFELTGQLIIGTATLTADGTSNGYVSNDLLISVTDRLIDLPTAQDLFLGETINIPLLIAPDAAGAGGVSINVESSDPSIVEVLTPVVIVPEGSFQTTVQVRAASAATGSAIITASNVGFAPDTTTISVTAALNILQSFSQFEEAETDQIFFNLLSGGGPFPAPAGGVEVSLTSSDSSCVAVASPSVIAEGSIFGSVILSYGGTAGIPCSATVTADAGLFGTDIIDVTIEAVPDIGTLTVADHHFGDYRLGSDTQIPFTVNLSNASHGGVTLQIKSSNPDVALVTTDATVEGAPVVELFVADGVANASFVVQGLSEATGSTNISVHNAQFTAGSRAVEVVPGVAQIVGLAATATTLSVDDPFYVRVGYLHSNGVSFRWARASAIGGPLAINVASSDASVGLIKNAFTSGSSLTVEVPVNDDNSPTSVGIGGVAFDPLGAGTTTIAATAPGFDASFPQSTLNVSVTQPEITVADAWFGDFRVGSDQQINYVVNLGGANHGGITVHIESSDPSVALLTTDPTVAGSSAIDLFIADGDTQEPFYVQGVSEATGSATITASQASFTTGTAPIEVVQGVARIVGLTTTATTLTADDNFYVQIGYMHSNGTSFRRANASAVGGPLTVTINSSDTSVGEVKTSSASGASVTVEVPVADDNSPTNLAAGGSAFDPIGGGVVSISATATGFGSYPGSSVDVTVSQPEITLSDAWWTDYRVGENLQIIYQVTLGGSAHGGVTVHVESDSSAALLSTDATTAGSSSVDLVIPDGQTTASFYVQGVSVASGITLTATQALFASDTAPLEVVPSVMRIGSLSANTNTLAPDDPFRVEFGYIHANGTTFRYANTSPAATPITVNFASDDLAVGQLVTSSATGSPVTVDVAANQRYSPSNVAGGGVALEPMGAGTVNVSATATGFDASYAPSTYAVNITQPALTLDDAWWGDHRVGEGLQIIYRVALGGADHGGVTVHLESDNSAALLSPDGTTSGGSAIDVFIPNGQTTYNFYVHGVSEAAVVNITATQALFSPAATTVEVVPSVFDIQGLTATRTTLSPDDPFRVQAGYVHANGTTFRYAYPSATAGAIEVTLTSDNISAGELVTGAATGSPVTVEIPVNTRYSPSSVVSGGVALRAAGEGVANITASASGFATHTTDTDTVTVSQPGMTMADTWWGDARIGGGLQTPYRVNLGASSHGGVTVRVASSDTVRLLVAPDATSAGTSFIDIFIPDGQTTASFYVQGINGVTGNVTLTASTPLFTNGTLGVDVVQGVIDIVNLGTSISAGAADDPFVVRTGYVHSNGINFRYAPVSATAAPLQVLVNSSDVGVGQLNTLVETGASVTVEVDANSFDSASTVATGGVAFDPISEGSTSVSTSVGGFNNGWAQSVETVTVTP